MDGWTTVKSPTRACFPEHAVETIGHQCRCSSTVSSKRRGCSSDSVCLRLRVVTRTDYGVHSWKILKGPNVFLLRSKATHVAGLTGCHFLVAIFHSVRFCLFSYLVECEARFPPSHRNPGTTKAKKPNRDVKTKETPIFQHHRRPRFSDLNFSCEIIQSEQAMGDRTGSCSAAPAG